MDFARVTLITHKSQPLPQPISVPWQVPALQMEMLGPLLHKDSFQLLSSAVATKIILKV